MNKLIDITLDITAITLSCAYASWLKAHKGLEPHRTWAEVGFGVGYTLGISYIRGAISGGDWRDEWWRTARDFALTAAPIVWGEIEQEIDAHRVLAQELRSP